MYNYRQHDISEATAKRLEETEARIDALNAEINAIFCEADGWEYEVVPLYDALEEAWDAFR